MTSISTSHLLRQEVDGRRPEDRGELQARDDVDEVDVVSGPEEGKRERGKGWRSRSRSRRG